ncbi:MAG: DUF1254 domain-containing protein [Terriglobales bacterium]
MTKLTRRHALMTSALSAPLLLWPHGRVSAQIAETPLAGTSEDERIALEAYTYGYSLITTEVTRVQMTNVSAPEGLHAPMETFMNVKRYPPADFHAITAPNADTLYSIAWLDLGKEPIVFSHPDMGKRYFMFPMYSLWMPVVETPSSRTTSGKAANFLVTGPGWSGQVPAGMTEIKSPTRYIVILGRIYANGTDADYTAVNALQAELKLTPLSIFGKAYTYQAPPVDPNPGYSMTDKPQTVILGMSAADYFNRMARLMGSIAPPAREDAPMLARMARIGIVPGQKFDPAKLSPAMQASLKDLPHKTLVQIEAHREEIGVHVNGWVIARDLGQFGTDYMKRAVVAAFGWPSNLDKDAVYPYAETDSTGQPLNGAHAYTVTFPAGQTPPVSGFWSITMYEIDKGWWFAPNPLNKFTVSARDNLKTNADGSTTLYFQNQSPGADKQSNWLPAPKGDFLLMLRMYWPKEGDPSILNGSWAPPHVIKAS